MAPDTRRPPGEMNCCMKNEHKRFSPISAKYSTYLYYYSYTYTYSYSWRGVRLSRSVGMIWIEKQTYVWQYRDDVREILEMRMGEKKQWVRKQRLPPACEAVPERRRRWRSGVLGAGCFIFERFILCSFENFLIFFWEFFVFFSWEVLFDHFWEVLFYIFERFLFYVSFLEFTSNLARNKINLFENNDKRGF